MEFFGWSGTPYTTNSSAVVGIDCNLPLLVQNFFHQHCCCVFRICVYIVRWWIINANYRFSVVMLMTDQQQYYTLTHLHTQWMCAMRYKFNQFHISWLSLSTIRTFHSSISSSAHVLTPIKCLCLCRTVCNSVHHVLSVYFVNTFQMSGLINISSTENIIM